MEREALDPAELLERLRRERPEQGWAPLLPSGAPTSWRDRPVAGSEALGYLNAHWVLPDQPETALPRRPIHRIVRRLAGRVVYAMLRPYLAQERELLARLVQVCNALAVRCDEMAAAIGDRELAEGENSARLLEYLDATSRGTTPRD